MNLGLNGLTGVNANVDISSLDVETALMAVQSRRAALLEDQLKSQLDTVQARNDQIAKLNDALAALNHMNGMFDGKTDLNAKLEKQGAWKAEAASNYPTERATNSALIDAGVPNLKLTGNEEGGGGVTNHKDADGKEVRLPNGVRGDVTKGQIERAIQEIKGQIDSASNSQQMEMLRLQSLSNKRNESFDVMTNFIKKMQESRSSIIGNMR